MRKETTSYRPLALRVREAGVMILETPLIFLVGPLTSVRRR